MLKNIKPVFLIIRILGGMLGSLLLLIVVGGTWFNPDYMFYPRPRDSTPLLTGAFISFGFLMLVPYSLIKNKFIYYFLFIPLLILVLLFFLIIAIFNTTKEEELALIIAPVALILLLISNLYVIYISGKNKFSKPMK